MSEIANRQSLLSQFAYRLSTIGYGLLAWIGRSPLFILILPSLWFFAFYLPFWKDIDALDELVWGFTEMNVLLAPPLYCVLARIPFWVTDTLLRGWSPGILSQQHPSLAAVYALIFCQHIGLWFSLRYFIFSLPASQAGRGAIALLLASVASFYAFAHTAGPESTIAITWFFLFGVGLRILTGTSSWRTWLLYFVILLFSIGSRHISGFLLGWLPTTAFVLMILRLVETGTRRFQNALPLAKTAGLALGLSIFCLLTEQAFVTAMCHHFGIIQRRTMGRTLSDRIGSYLDSLKPEAKERAAQHAASLTDDPDVRATIDAFKDIGTYHKGTDEFIAQFLRARGLSGESLEVERDRITLEGVSCYYRTWDPNLIRIILRDIGKGFYPTNDQGIAMTGAKATFNSLGPIKEDPSSWKDLQGLLIFDPSVAQATLDRAFHDIFIRHWRFLPLGAWLFLFSAIAAWRLVRGRLSLELALISLCIFGIGLVTYAVNCVCNYSMPRYVLPLLVAIFAAGAVCSASRRAKVA
ncbi:MAG TPA: hypothetical protein VE242_02200 [Chthoniobacterales bacterium]|nr:hypothetical protein [Chthoniobacterales bacterium]